MWSSELFNLGYFQLLAYLGICPLHCSSLQKGVSDSKLGLFSAVHPTACVGLHGSHLACGGNG